MFSVHILEEHNTTLWVASMLQRSPAPPTDVALSDLQGRAPLCPERPRKSSEIIDFWGVHLCILRVWHLARRPGPISGTILGPGTARLPAWDNNCIKSSCVGQNRIRFPFARAELGVVLLFCRNTKAITFQHNLGR